MIKKLFCELGEEYKIISEDLSTLKSIKLSKTLNNEEKLRIAILLEKEYIIYTENKNIIINYNINGLLKRLLIPQYLLLIEKYYPKDLINFQNIIFGEIYNKYECINKNIFIINEDIFNEKRQKNINEDIKINYIYLNKKLYNEIIYKFFNKKYGFKVSKLFETLINFPESFFNEFDELTIYKLFSQPFITKIEKGIAIDYNLLKHYIIVNMLVLKFGKISGRILQFAFDKIEFYDEELILNTLISKDKIKLHTIRLYKMGYLQLINPEGSRIQKWSFDIYKVIECFKRDSINFINENFGKKMSKDNYKKYFSSILSLFFIKYSFKNVY